jgi:hypothetical protein
MFKLLWALPLLVIVAAPRPAGAQGKASHFAPPVPVSFSVTIPLGKKPPYSAGQFFGQSATGLAGGVLGGMAVAIPFMLASWDSPSPPNEALMIAAISTAYVGGVMAGVHWAGRRQGTIASPFASAAGVLGGLMVSGAIISASVDEEGQGGGVGSLLVFVLPSMGASAGHALTRRAH